MKGKMEKHGGLVCCALLSLLLVHGGQAVHKVNQTNGQAIDLTQMDRELAATREWQSNKLFPQRNRNKDVTTQTKWDNLIKGEYPTTFSHKISSDHVTRMLDKNQRVEFKRNQFVIPAPRMSNWKEATNSQLKPGMGKFSTTKEKMNTSQFSSIAVTGKSLNISEANSERKGEERKRDSQSQQASVFINDRTITAIPTPCKLGSKIVRGHTPVDKDLAAERRPLLSHSLLFSPPGSLLSILCRVQLGRGINSRARGTSSKSNSNRTRMNKLMNNVAGLERKFVANTAPIAYEYMHNVRKNNTFPAHSFKNSIWRAQLSRPYHYFTKGPLYLEQPLPPLVTNGQKPDTDTTPAGGSMIDAPGMLALPDEISTEGLSEKDGDAKVRWTQRHLDPSIPLFESVEKRTLSESSSVNLGGKRGRERVRRDAQNSSNDGSDGGYSGDEPVIRITSNTWNDNLASTKDFQTYTTHEAITRTEHLNIESSTTKSAGSISVSTSPSVPQVTKIINMPSSTQTSIMTSVKSSSEESVTSHDGTTSSKLSTATSNAITSSNTEETHPSASLTETISLPSTSPSRPSTIKIINAPQTSDMSSLSAISSSNLPSPTTSPTNKPSQSTVSASPAPHLVSTTDSDTSQATMSSLMTSANSSVTDTSTGQTSQSTNDTSTLSVSPVADRNEDQPITTQDSATSIKFHNQSLSTAGDRSVFPTKMSKFSLSSTIEDNDVLPTESSHKRTLRSTDSSSSDSTSSSAMSSTDTSTSRNNTASTAPSTPTPSPDQGSMSPNLTFPETLSPSQTNATTPMTTSPPVQSNASVTTTASPTSTDNTTPDLAASTTTLDLFGDLATVDPEPYPEGHPYPEPGYGGENKADGTMEEEEEPVSEPGPDWDEAKMVWQEAWEVHLYVFACLFGCLGIYTLVCVLRMWGIHRLLSRRYFVSLNLLMMLMCVSRAVYLSIDGYNSNGTFHPSLDYFFYSISFPCLTSAFSIQLYALLQATKMQFLPPTIQKMSFLMTMILFHFAISLVTDVIVGMYAGMRIMLFVCQLFYILWGLFLFIGYAYIFRRLYLHAVKRQKNVVVQHAQNGSGGNSMYNSRVGGGVKPKSKFTLSVAVKVTFSTAILGLVTIGLEVYAVVAVYKNFSNDRPSPWPWYIYHTVLRFVEFLMCATMCYVASQPFRYRKGRQACCCPVLCAPCAEICCCGADVNKSDGQAAWSELEQHRASLDRSLPHNGSYHQGQGLGYRASKSSQRSGGVGDVELTVPAKARIYFSDQDDVRPIVTSQPGSRPTSMTSETFESVTASTAGSLSGEGSVGMSTPARTVPGSHAAVNMIPMPVKSGSGVVNSAYMTAVDDPQSSRPQSPGHKSRKSSVASSEFFQAPSLSLADSMASELDKAFRSMHEDEQPPNLSTFSLTERQHVAEPAKPPTNNSVQQYVQNHTDESTANSLRRARSASGRSSFCEDETPQQNGDKMREMSDQGQELDPNGAWHNKLFRSCSDNLNGIRTKDVDKATYMSLLDIEQNQLQQEPRIQNDDKLNTKAISHGPEGYQSFTPDSTVIYVDGKVPSQPEKHQPANERSDDAQGVRNGISNSDNKLKKPVPAPRVMKSDATNVVTSPNAPYYTVISVVGGRSFKDEDDVGHRGSSPGVNSLSTSSPFPPAPTVYTTGPTTSPRGLMTYGAADDDDDDIEV